MTRFLQTLIVALSPSRPRRTAIRPATLHVEMMEDRLVPSAAHWVDLVPAMHMNWQSAPAVKVAAPMADKVDGCHLPHVVHKAVPSKCHESVHKHTSADEAKTAIHKAASKAETLQDASKASAASHKVQWQSPAARKASHD
jgi:hypothetical protein